MGHLPGRDGLRGLGTEGELEAHVSVRGPRGGAGEPRGASVRCAASHTGSQDDCGRGLARRARGGGLSPLGLQSSGAVRSLLGTVFAVQRSRSPWLMDSSQAHDEPPN
ncbi:unnamed protein product [Rangifer tarandus platyrhynchus]|uniref:Uncharacterized protein n=1 Tax=Rangifer tarandus platyrhynchus TaxID=3082113 RepID=A0AC59YWL9_RANTA